MKFKLLFSFLFFLYSTLLFSQEEIKTGIGPSLRYLMPSGLYTQFNDAISYGIAIRAPLSAKFVLFGSFHYQTLKSDEFRFLFVTVRELTLTFSTAEIGFRFAPRSAIFIQGSLALNYGPDFDADIGFIPALGRQFQNFDILFETKVFEKQLQYYAIRIQYYLF